MKNKSDFLICDMTKEDDDCLKKIGMTCFNVNIDTHHDLYFVRMMFHRYFSKRKFKKRRQQGVIIRGLKENDEVVGFYELEKDGLLSSLYVLPDKQKKGYGKALVQDAIEVAKKSGMKEIRLDASDYAKAFYLHLGFKQYEKKRVVLGVNMIPFKFKIT